MIINNLNEMRDFAHKFASLLIDNDVINLIGDMGAGKTTLTNFIAEYFNIDDSSSPTFSIVNIYEGDKTIYHLDLYRMEDPDELLEIDFETYFYPDNAITLYRMGRKWRSFLAKWYDKC